MATLLDKKYTNKDTDSDIINAIHKLASDKNGRLMLKEHCEWLEVKLKEINRLSLILKSRKTKKSK